MQRALVPIVLAVIFLVLMVFYLVPGVSHPLVSTNPAGVHIKHVLLFGGLTVLSLIWLRFSLNSSR